MSEENGAPPTRTSGWRLPVVIALITSVAVIVAAAVPHFLDYWLRSGAPAPQGTAAASATPHASSTFSVLVRNGFGPDVRGADFDVPEARNTDDAGVADIVLGTEDFLIHLPGGGAWLGPFSGDGRGECAANRVWAQRISMEELRDGQTLCLRTTQQRLVVAHVSELYSEPDETRFRLKGMVWS